MLEKERVFIKTLFRRSFSGGDMNLKNPGAANGALAGLLSRKWQMLSFFKAE